ncbi:MAG: LPS export ABC transporter permease LptF [Bdellovibrionales bacterium]
MSELARGRLAIKYILIETLPSFVIGVAVFLFILLMFQALRLTEFVLVHGVSFQTIGQIMVYLAVSFLPVILPMSLLFAILLTYGRLSSDAEIVAMKALGLNLIHLTIPALIVGAMATFASAHTSFYLAPWGNRQFEVLINELGRLKAGATIKEGVFSEGFFDLVVYANQVDSKAGLLSKVFIFDERDPQSPLTIIAREGRLIRDADPRSGDRAHLQLVDGSIHRTQQDNYTKIDFSTYDINLFDPVDLSEKSKSLPSMSINELNHALKKSDLEPKQRVKMEVERQRRWALSLACLIFAFVGVGLGTTTNRRLARSSGMVLSLIVIIGYWVLYVTAEGLARNQSVPAPVAIWGVNVIFCGFAVWAMKRAQHS